MDRPFHLLAPAWTPDPHQIPFLTADAPTRVLACGRQWGKSDACAADLALELLSPPKAEILLVGPVVEQARIVFERVAELLETLGHAPKVRRGGYPELTLGENRLRARSAKRPASLRGLRATHVVVDEAAYVESKTVRDVLLPMLAAAPADERGRAGRLTLVSTPCGRGLFHELFLEGQNPDRKAYWSRQAPTSENPRVTRSFLEAQRELLPEDAYAREYEAAFNDHAGVVFRGLDIEGCLALEPRNQSEVPGGAPRGAPGGVAGDEPVTIGVDWGRRVDATAFVVVAGTERRAEILEIVHLPRTGWLAQRDALAALLARYPRAKVVADDTGVGLGVNEFLAEPGSPLRLPAVGYVGVNFAGDRKADMVARLGLALERRRLRLLPDRGLLRELGAYTAVTLPSGATRYEASPNAGGGHDDLVCALMLAVAHLPSGHKARILLGAPRDLAAPHPAPLPTAPTASAPTDPGAPSAAPPAPPAPLASILLAPAR